MSGTLLNCELYPFSEHEKVTRPLSYCSPVCVWVGVWGGGPERLAQGE